MEIWLRLATGAGSSWLRATEQVTAEDARKAAAAILADSKYRPRKRDPGVLSWIGQRVQSVLAALGRFVRFVVPGSGLLEFIGTCVAVVAIGGLVGAVLVRRRRRVRVSIEAQARVDTVEFDRLADAAYASGDFREAVLFRFRAGIAHLEAGPRPGASRRTNARIATNLPPVFPGLGTTFDEIRYGDAPAVEQQARTAIEEWPKVIQGAERLPVDSTEVLLPHRRARRKRTPKS